jgi:hypothetical protein
LNAIQALSQLSYNPVAESNLPESALAVKQKILFLLNFLKKH